MNWKWILLSYLICAAVFFWFGILYRARKIKQVVAILKDSTLSADEKFKKLVALLI